MNENSPLGAPVGPDADGSEALQRAAGPLGAWKRILLFVRAIEVRLRFIAILAAVGLFIGCWDTIKNYWDKYARPHAAAAKQLPGDQEFFCPMDPNVVRSSYEPNGDIPKCPICGMPLSVHKKEQKQELPPGVTGRVQISPERIQLAGIQTVPVRYLPLSKQITTVGTVVFDENRVSQVVSQVSGHVEKLHTNKTNWMVQGGEPLAEISSTVIPSPRTGIVIDQKIAVGSRTDVGTILFEVADPSAVWVEADIYEKDIGLLEPELKIEAAFEAFPNRTFTGRLRHIAPRLDTATRSYRVRFQLDNLQYGLRRGMFATVRIQVPVDRIEPFRSLTQDKAQITLASAGDGQRMDHPSHDDGQAGHASHDSGRMDNQSSEPRAVLAVPEASVIDTGAKTIVYVRHKSDRAGDAEVFEGVEVRLGPRGEAQVDGKSAVYYPVLDGLRPGDEIAAAGAFLVDAETRLNPGAASTYFGASGGPQPSSSAKPQMEHAMPHAEPLAASQPKPSEPAVASNEPSPEELERLSQLSPEDRALAECQRLCPITGKPLASMAVPYKITLRGQPVLLCCEGCVGKAKAAPDETLKKVEKFKAEKGR